MHGADRPCSRPDDVAKLFTVVCILVGLGVFAAFITEALKHRAAAIERLRDRREPDTGRAAPGAASSSIVAPEEDRA